MRTKKSDTTKFKNHGKTTKPSEARATRFWLLCAVAKDRNRRHRGGGRYLKKIKTVEILESKSCAEYLFGCTCHLYEINL